MLLVGRWVNDWVFVAAYEVVERERRKSKTECGFLYIRIHVCVCGCVCLCVIIPWLNGPISAGPVGGRGACGWNFSHVSK